MRFLLFQLTPYHLFKNDFVSIYSGRLKAHSHEDEICNKTSNDEVAQRQTIKRLTTNGGVTLDSTVAANVRRLTVRQNQTLLERNDNVSDT